MDKMDKMDKMDLRAALLEIAALRGNIIRSMNWSGESYEAGCIIAFARCADFVEFWVEQGFDFPCTAQQFIAGRLSMPEATKNWWRDYATKALVLTGGMSNPPAQKKCHAE